MIDQKNAKLEKLLYGLGVSPNVLAFDYLADAVAAWRPGKPLMQVYAYVGQLYGASVGNVERCMRYAVYRACDRAGSNALWTRMFGDIVDPERGAPTTGEFIARVWREVNAN